MMPRALSSRTSYMVTARQPNSPQPQGEGRTIRHWDGHQPLTLGHPFSWIIEKTPTGVRVRNLRSQNKDFRTRVVNLSHDDVDRGLTVKLPQMELTIRKAQAGLATVSLPAVIDQEAIATQKSQDRLFNRFALSGFALVGLIGIWSLATSLQTTVSTPSQDVIPPQFAKLLLKKPQGKRSAGSPSADSAGSRASTSAQQKVADAPASVKKSAMVQSMTHSSVQTAMSSLLKGGMSKLLKESQFVSGQTTSASRALLNQTSGALAVGHSVQSMIGHGSQAVQGLGGAGAGGVGGQGVGYGKGGKAGVKGQGGAFVSLDLGGASVEEGLSKDEVGEVIHRHISEVRYCYESTMVRNPDAEGKVMIQFTIVANGTVKSAEVKSSSVPDPRLDDCVLRRLQTWKFPNPKGGVNVTVAYPFIFKPLGK